MSTDLIKQNVSTSPEGSEISERWKDVPGLPGYRVSSFGRVQTCRLRGRGNRLAEGWRDLRQGKINQGHRYVRLYKNSKMTRVYVHRLVLELFVGDCPEGMECCHGDGDPSNNRLSNLRWDTHQKNLEDRRQHGTMNWGERCGAAKLSEDEVRLIRRLKAQGVHRKELAARFDVVVTQIDNIVSWRRWAHLDVGLTTRKKARNKPGK